MVQTVGYILGVSSSVYFRKGKTSYTPTCAGEWKAMSLTSGCFCGGLRLVQLVLSYSMATLARSFIGRPRLAQFGDVNILHAQIANFVQFSPARANWSPGPLCLGKYFPTVMNS